MNRLGKRALFTAFCVAYLPWWAYAQSAQTIYKHIDGQGRVTYSNAPIAGGARVELEPITLIPPTPTGSLVNPNLPRPYVASAVSSTVSSAAPVVSTAVSNVAPPTSTPVLVAPTAGQQVTAAESPVLPAAPAPIVTMPPVATVAIVRPVQTATIKRLPLPANVEQPLPMDVLIQQRHDEIKLRSMHSAIDTELKLLSEAKARLAEEKKVSDGVRAIKASFNTALRPSESSQGPIIPAEARAKVERHFERVRDLQDQIAMHEKNLADLRASQKTETNMAKIATASSISAASH